MRPIQLLRIVCVLIAPLLIALSAGRAAADPDDGQWDPTLPKTISAGAPGDPVAIANASLQASAQAAQTTMDLGRRFLGSLGLLSGFRFLGLFGHRFLSGLRLLLSLSLGGDGGEGVLGHR